MKKILYIAASAVFSLGMVSCSLDAENMTDSTSENFPKTEADATASLAAIYENLNAVNANPQMSFYYLSMLASDDNLGGGGANDKLMQARQSSSIRTVLRVSDVPTPYYRLCPIQT